MKKNNAKYVILIPRYKKFSKVNILHHFISGLQRLTSTEF